MRRHSTLAQEHPGGTRGSSARSDRRHRQPEVGAEGRYHLGGELAERDRAESRQDVTIPELGVYPPRLQREVRNAYVPHHVSANALSVSRPPSSRGRSPVCWRLRTSVSKRAASALRSNVRARFLKPSRQRTRQTTAPDFLVTFSTLTTPGGAYEGLLRLASQPAAPADLSRGRAQSGSPGPRPRRLQGGYEGESRAETLSTRRGRSLGIRRAARGRRLWRPVPARGVRSRCCQRSRTCSIR